MNQDFEASLDFLRTIYPTGPWMLTSISVDKKSIDARTFVLPLGDPEGTALIEEECLAWLGLHKLKNLYYSVNVPIRSAFEKRKLAKSDVEEVRFLHVDVDPRAGEDVEQEQDRILRQLMEYKIPPTAIVFSGGGYNALWRLSRALPVARDASTPEEVISRAIDVERRNWQFELDFATPDHCRDVSRILRLPGTINRPGAEKIAKGRVPNLARVQILNDVSYPYEVFAATPHVSAPISSSAGSRVCGDVRRVESLEHLPPTVSDRTKILISQGFDPDKPGWDGDRSGMLFRVCCELVRANVSDDIILGIITDGRYLISASVLDKGTGMARYAQRQLRRAKDMVINPKLAAINEECAVIENYGGKCVVMFEPKDGSSVEIQKLHDFELARNHRKVAWTNGNGRVVQLGEGAWWLEQESRRQYAHIVFEPGIEATPGDYNLWRGFSVQPAKGERHVRLLTHMFENVCQANQEHFDYLIHWMARVVQFPRTQSMVAPVLLGQRGVGKSIFVDFFGRIFDPHRFTASDINGLTGKFNSHLGQCVLVVAEEAFDLREKRHESVLKDRITGQTLALERKGFDIIQVPNYIHLIMLSNNERVVPAGDHERRFFVIRVGEKQMQDSAYFGKIIEDRKNGGVAHLLRYLLDIDLSNFDVTRVPRTQELALQQAHNLTGELDWWLAKLDQGYLAPGHASWTQPVLKRTLYEDYLLYAQALNIRMPKGERVFSQFMLNEIPGLISRQIKIQSGDRPYIYVFPPLDECRKQWDRRRGWHTNWNTEEPVEEPGFRSAF